MGEGWIFLITEGLVKDEDLSNLIFLANGQFSQYNLLNHLPLLFSFWSLFNLYQVLVYIGPSILFHWSVSWFLQQWQTILITSFIMHFNNQKIRIPLLFFLFQNTLILNQNRKSPHLNSRKAIHVDCCVCIRIHPILSVLPRLTWKSWEKTLDADCLVPWNEGAH